MKKLENNRMAVGLDDANSHSPPLNAQSVAPRDTFVNLPPSSLIEGINGLLKQFLHNHRAFHSPETLQLYLNLFVLWHNTRVFERDKRQGKSPYQWAGIDPGDTDWLALLGYPAQ